MILRKRFAAALLLIACTLAPAQGLCADETALFNSIQPDVLILLDLSGSMKRNPAGIFQIYGNEDCSIVDGMGWTDCRRYIIAKRAVFNLLDDNRDGKIDSSDETSLNIRVGYVAYYLAMDFVTEVTGIRRAIGTPYADLYCNSNGNSTACTKTKEDTACTTMATAGLPMSFYCEKTNSDTPMNSALRDARTYLDTHKAACIMHDVCLHRPGNAM